MLKTVPKISVMLLYRGTFSGSTRSLLPALEKNGCKVVQSRSSLRYLRCRIFCIIYMVLNAMLVYKSKFRKYINRTYAAFMCMSKANQALMARCGHVDAVIQIGANYNSFWKTRNNNQLYTIFTDHTNMLSKKESSAWYRSPESDVHDDWNSIEKQIFNSQDHIFVMGSQVKASLVDDYAMDADAISVVGAGPNLDVDAERDGVHKRYDAKTILFVGLDGKRKGLDLLINAFNDLLEAFPDARLHVAGVEGDNSRGVTYHGAVHGEALKELYYDAQVFVLPTFREPFGIVLLEAMFAKNACVAFRTGAIPEIIRDQETGFIVDVGDVEALKKRLAELLSDPALIEAMGEAGYKTAKANWTWDLTARKMVGQIEAMLANKGYKDAGGGH